MEIIDAIKNKENVLLLVSSNDLKEFAEYIVKRTIDLIEKGTVLNEEIYYTRDQVVKILNVNPATLWNWSNKGYLIPVKVGGLNRYKKSDIDRIIDHGK